jgi:hypothetical protein
MTPDGPTRRRRSRGTARRLAVGLGAVASVLLAALGLLVGAAPAAAACTLGSAAPVSFPYTGAEACYVVAPAVMSVHVLVIGAGGAGGPSSGASVTADLTVTPGETLYVEVGGSGASDGFNGGGARGGAPSGGGASDIRTCPQPCAATPLTGQAGTDPRLVVAGGGGGAGAAVGASATGGPGGDSGATGAAGAAGIGPGGAGGGGGGATQSAGGTAGASGGGGPGAIGTVGVGADTLLSDAALGGAGGGGWFGGGSGGGGPGPPGTAGGGGGGGSSFGPPGAVFAATSAAALVRITPITPDTSPPTALIALPTDGAHYGLNELVIALYSCVDPDGAADVASCAGPVGSGRRVDTSTAGVHTFTVTAVDQAGNVGRQSAAYTVDRQAAPTPGAPTQGTATPSSPAGPTPPPAATSTSPPPAQPPPTTSPAAPGVAAPPAAATSAPRTVPGIPPTTVAPTTPSATPVLPGATVPGLTLAAPAGASPVHLDRYDPRSEPKKVVGFGVVAYTLLELGAGGGLALAGLGAIGLSGAPAGGAARDKGPGGGTIAGTSVTHLQSGVRGEAPGDRSRSWRWAGTAALDDWSVSVPAWLATRSPLAARIVTDGGYLRSAFGSASTIVYLAGLALGVAAVVDTGGRALPPSTFLTLAAIAIGVLDAAAGFATVLTFAAGVALLGGIDSTPALRTLLGLGALWFVVPLLAGAARPLRRPPAADGRARFDRGADFVIASLISAWAVQKIVSGLPGLAGYHLPIAKHADAAAVLVLVAVCARLAAETLAIHLYPRRVAALQTNRLRSPATPQRLGAIAVRTAIFVLVATVVVGRSWQLWVGTALFAAPQILSIYEARLPNSPRLFRVLPRGLLKLVLMLFVGTAIGVLVTDSLHGSKSIIENAFVLLALPGLAVTLLGMFARDGQAPPIGWSARGGGVVVLGAGLALVLGYVVI